MMKKVNILFLCENAGRHKHAGSKARQDIINILAQLNFEYIYNYSLDNNIGENKNQRKIIYYYYRILNCIKTWIELRNIKRKNIIFQYPDYSSRLIKPFIRKFLQKNNMIYIVHDIDSWRNMNKKESMHEEKCMLNEAKILIVHNQSMAEKLLEFGINKPHILKLELFDYLTDEYISEKKFDKQIIFAGNLSKSKFLKSYMALERNYMLQLYGIGLDTEESLPPNTQFNGSFSPEIIPKVIPGGFGLIWDGESIETCSGDFGKYLKYNNPHKLSLYLASGIPVIVWKKAAIATFVEENQIGFCVDSLYEIESIMQTISIHEYETLVENVKKIQSKVLKGEYFKKAIMETIKLL